jgi:hypothetical protein
MNNIYKFLSIGVLGYVGYEFWLSQQAVVVPAPSPNQPTMPPTEPITVATNNSLLSIVTTTEVSSMLSVMGVTSATMLSMDQWNYGFNKLTGAKGPAAEEVGAIGPMLVGTWFALITGWAKKQAGVSGLGELIYGRF